MKVYVKVRMKAEFIYDLLLFHTSGGSSGRPAEADRFE